MTTCKHVICAIGFAVLTWSIALAMPFDHETFDSNPTPAAASAMRELHEEGGHAPSGSPETIALRATAHQHMPAAQTTAEGAAGDGAGAPERVPAEQERYANLEYAEISTLWRSEELDAKKTADVEDELRTSFTDLSTKGRIIEVSCRTTLCRAMLEFDEPDEVGRYAEASAPDLRTWLDVLPSSTGFALEVYFARD